ncbi:2'-5' RNA ligase [Aurantiacibacter luteus]|uniref:RNA 2',3'-cyclic phosphodiesterase n=1 Tax=Aurantiacibacter luteus TaxID=1581420 RepID=A0A0G9N3P6_9SPHN|nr:2'-5' RNA ligase [Aurantiacibacter luteus]
MRRIFIALRPPDSVCEALLDTMEGVPGARWQDADNLHVTLRFIGEVDRHAFADVITAMESVSLHPFEIKVAGVGHFEGRNRPRALWARVEPSASLADLQHSVEIACRRAGMSPETRRFVPHITLARLNAGSAPIGDWLAANGALALPSWRAESFALFESELGRSEAIYQEIAQFP